MGQAADFFVSYTSADRAWAEWTAWQLEADGYHVVFQGWDFVPGYDWAHGMQRATSTAERLVVVLSAAYLQSVHGEAERRTFYAKDPSGEHGLLLPVRVGDVEPPGLLKTRIYVDLVGRDANSARATLLAAARRVRGKPTSEPEFPGMPGPSINHGTEAPQFPGEAENKTPTRSTHDLRDAPDLAPSSRPPRSELPPELLEALSSEAAGRRVEAVAELGRLLHASPGEIAEQARALLQQLIDDDSRPVSRAAIRALSTRPSAYRTRGKIELLHAELAYPGARALLDEAAHRAPRSVLLREVSERTGSRTEQISAELGAMTKLCKRLFGRDAWPVTVRSTADGASYQMDPEIAQWWRQASDPDADLTLALEVATRVAADRRQEAVPLEFANVDDAAAYRVRLRSALTERTAAGDIAMRHVRPWVWTRTSGGSALTEIGNRTGVEVRLSFYR
jgi:TIR domain